jgi:hypothetical protein
MQQSPPGQNMQPQTHWWYRARRQDQALKERAHICDDRNTAMTSMPIEG